MNSYLRYLVENEFFLFFSNTASQPKKLCKELKTKLLVNNHSLVLLLDCDFDI